MSRTSEASAANGASTPSVRGHRLEFRVSSEELATIDEIKDESGLTRTAVVRDGITRAQRSGGPLCGTRRGAEALRINAESYSDMAKQIRLAGLNLMLLRRHAQVGGNVDAEALDAMDEKLARLQAWADARAASAQRAIEALSWAR